MSTPPQYFFVLFQSHICKTFNGVFLYANYVISKFWKHYHTLPHFSVPLKPQLTVLMRKSPITYLGLHLQPKSEG